MKKTLLHELFDILKNELISNKGANRLLVLILIANIPIYGIFHFGFTQGLTIILILIYMKNYPWDKLNGIDFGKYTNKNILGIPTIPFVMLSGTALTQLFLLIVPFATQLIALFMIGSYLLLITRKTQIN